MDKSRKLTRKQVLELVEALILTGFIREATHPGAASECCQIAHALLKAAREEAGNSSSQDATHE